jgi:cytochrome c oxidase cbb3-type subunit 1
MWVNGHHAGADVACRTTADGTLTYSFAESVEASYAGYVRTLHRWQASSLLGMLVMAWNIWKTREMAPGRGARDG